MATICIWTPQGLKCSASPIKSHVPGSAACVHGDTGTRQMVKSRHGSTHQLLVGDLVHLADDDPWPGQGPANSHAARARVIARVVELLYAADVDADTPFTIVKL